MHFPEEDNDSSVFDDEMEDEDEMEELIREDKREGYLQLKVKNEDWQFRINEVERLMTIAAFRIMQDPAIAEKLAIIS